MTPDTLNKLFLRMAEELDISDTLFKKAENSYTALGNYIGNHCAYPISIYTQGSFRLGTVVRPLSDEDDYDLDLVCEISVGQQVSASTIKSMIGKILRESARYSSMLEEKKRCWRIEYADEAQFHIDITPARPALFQPLGIDVTNKDTQGVYTFRPSNPKGYEAWFVQRKSIATIKRVFDSASIEPVKTHADKTSLQRAIQILKRHRDIMFESNSDNAPISIIITTLAAHAYSGESGVFDALKKILETMSNFIQRDGSIYTIPNPSNTGENFADKWNEKPEKAKAFFAWLAKAQHDILTLAPMITEDFTALEESFGHGIVGRSIAETTQVLNESQLSTAVYSKQYIQTALSVNHRLKPSFSLPRSYMLGICATVTKDGYQSEYQNDGPSIPKGASIDFSLLVSNTLTRGNYQVLWQVVNTGYEARHAGCLRGGFEKENNTTRRHEGTEYAGTHFVQAFLMKKGRCIAMSREFFVNIA